MIELSQQSAVAGLSRQEIIELIETIMVYKFPRLGREEIEQMFGLSELKQTRVYQEAREEGRQEGHQEGRQEGRQEEGATLVLRQLTRRVGQLTPEVRSLIQQLPLAQLEELGEALLDFDSVQDLTDWLQA